MFDEDRQLVHSRRSIKMVLPSLKVSGGTKVALDFLGACAGAGATVNVVKLWTSTNEWEFEDSLVTNLTSCKASPPVAVVSLPTIVFKFILLIWRLREYRSAWIFTHYTTLPLSVLIPRSNRWVLVQGLEWKFPRMRILQGILEKFILFLLKRSNVIAANGYIHDELTERGIQSYNLSIWADGFFENSEERHVKDIDVLFFYRRGAVKRTDLYLKFCNISKSSGSALKITCVSAEGDYPEILDSLCSRVYVLPQPSLLRELYARSKILLMFSDHEGFSLPPVEAMGSGCVPVCRNSGGPSIYMTGPLEELLFPLDAPIEILFQATYGLIQDPDRLASTASYVKKSFHSGHKLFETRKIEISNRVLS